MITFRMLQHTRRRRRLCRSEQETGASSTSQISKSFRQQIRTWQATNSQQQGRVLVWLFVYVRSKTMMMTRSRSEFKTPSNLAFSFSGLDENGKAEDMTRSELIKLQGKVNDDETDMFH